MTNNNWEKLYANGKHLNRYPFGEFVSVYFNSLKYFPPYTLESSVLEVLEIGCGSGNNLWFLAEQGHNCYGIDGSASAIMETKRTLESRNVNAKLYVAEFQDLPFKDQSMDMIIDRESLCCQDINNIDLSLNEVKRVLKKGGVYISFRFSDTHPTLALLNQGLCSGKCIEKNTWEDIGCGGLSGTGITHFSSIDELKQQHSFLNLKYINEHKNIITKDYSNDNRISYAEYILVGTKK